MEARQSPRSDDCPVPSGPEAEPAQMQRQLDYLCLQPTRQGQASYAHVNEIVAGLRRRGWDVRLIEPPHPRRRRADGVRRAIAAVVVQAQYWARCRLQPAPFVYIRTHFLSLPTAFLARASGALVVQEVNGPLEDTYDAWPQLRRLHRLISFAVRTQLRWADAVITVTPGLTEYVAGITGRRRACHVVGNGANVDQFVPSTDRVGADRRPYVVFVGALATWQGIDVALRATQAASWPPTVDLLIAGDGRERPLIESAQRASSRIRWLGAIPYRQSATLMAESLAALVPKADGPSARFGLSPLKLFEAMACGVPVIASDLPGLRDVVQAHDCGLIFVPGDADALAQAVARIAGDPGEAAEMGSRGRAAAVALYSWDARAGQTEQILLEIGRKSCAGR